MDDRDTFYASSRAAWRKWLMNNHNTHENVWLIIYKKDSGQPTVNYQDAVKEALCFGWIDSVPNKRDAESYYQYFSVRNPKSNWSKVNKNYVKELEAQGLLQPSGIHAIESAKASGTWDALNEVDDLIIPEDLLEEFSNYVEARKNFENFPPSIRRGILEWIFNAVKAETRSRRIKETARLAEVNVRANQYKRK